MYTVLTAHVNLPLASTLRVVASGVDKDDGGLLVTRRVISS